MKIRVTVKNQRGFSLIEMVVTLAIISIVSVGLMSLLWVDSWWLFKLSNKTDNVIAAQQFLDRFSAEVRTAESATILSQPVSAMVIKIPVFESDRIGNNPYLGWPIQSYDSLTYQTIADTDNPGQFKITRSITSGGVPLSYHPEDGRTTLTDTTILTGVVGPINPSTNLPKTFEQSTTGGVTVNIEMLRTTSANKASDPIFFRTQVFLHNASIGLK